MKPIKQHSITQKRLQELLDFDPVTGVFRWRKGNGRRVAAGDVAGSKDAWGYLKISVDGALIGAHRLAWLYVYGEIPETTVKHRNGVGSDNRIANLYSLEKPEKGKKKPPTAARVRELFDYDPISGELIWKVATSSRNPMGSIAGSIAPTGYRFVSVDWNRFLAHRIVWLWNYGVWPSSDLDHVNGDKSDNRLDNLRLANRSQNMSNTGLRKDNSTGFKGVSWHAQNKKWRAYIQKDGKFLHLGLFDTKEEASAAYSAAALALQSEFARTS